MELRKIKQLPETNIETDSYIAVQLIEAQKALNFDTLRSMAEDVRGNFTFTVLDETNTLWFVKGNSPLNLIYFPELNLYVYTSTASIMATALKHTPLRSLHYEVIEAEEGDILRITPDGKLTRDQFRVPFVMSSRFNNSRLRYSLNDITGWDYEEDDFGVEEEEEEFDLMDDEDWAYLIDLCGYFNVSRNTVLCLLHMGYTYDEIEDYLYSSGAFDGDDDDLYSFCGEI